MATKKEDKDSKDATGKEGKEAAADSKPAERALS